MFIRRPRDFFPDILHEQKRCPCCREEFIVGAGVGVEDLYENTSSGEKRYGTAMFCSYKCVITAVAPMGNG